MPQIREVVSRMAEAHQVILTRGSSLLATDALEGGPIRIRRGLRFGDGHISAAATERQ